MIVNIHLKNILRNTFSLGIGRTIGIVVSAINFIIVARYLGVEKFGIYTSVLAILRIITPLASYGAPLLLVQRHSEGYGFIHLRRYVRLIFLTAAFWYMFALSTSYIVLPSFSSRLLLFVTLMFFSDVLLVALHELFFAMYQSTDKVHLSVPYAIAVQAIRLAVNLFLVWVGYLSLITIATVQVMANAFVLYFFWQSICRRIGQHFEGEIKTLPPFKADFSLGLYFSFSLLSKSVYNDIDKTMLPRLASLSSAGLYSSAYRILEMAFIPLISFLTVTFPRFLKAGETGKKSILQFLASIFPWTICYGLLATLILFFSAPLIPYFLGQEYAQAINIIRWLSPIIFLMGILYPLADTLTGLGRQPLRTKIQVAVLFLNIVLNLVLIPRMGWLGAAVVSLVSQGMLGLGMFAGIVFTRAECKLAELRTY